MVARVFKSPVPPRYWPSFSPELLAIREYRCGVWITVDKKTSVKRPLKTLEELCERSMVARETLVRLGSPGSFRFFSGGTTYPTIQDADGYEESLRKYFCSAYQNSAVKLVPSKRDGTGNFLIIPPAASDSKVTVIIPTRDHIELLRLAIDAVLGHGGQINIEIIVVDNGSTNAQTDRYLRELSLDGTVLVVRDDEPFNWSRINNKAARLATGDVLVFLNNDIEAIENDWLQRIAAFALMSDVGCVGPMLLYPDNSIQHAGVVVGMGRWADHLHKFGDANSDFNATPFVPPSVTRPVLALTGACLAISRLNFERLGGFDEAFQIVFSDVELCVRAHKRGLRNLYLGDVRLYHHESKSRDPQDVPDSDFHRARITLEPFRTKVCDPYFHPRLHKLSLTPKSDLLPTDLARWMRK
jgi:GT2 family glycosyltransferase